MSVRVRDMMIASVACKGVFRRYAQLSAEEQAEVVNRVKEKLTENGGESNDETVIDKEAVADTVLDTDGNQNSEEGEAEGGDELSEEDIAAIDEIAVEDAPIEDAPVEDAPVEDVPVEDGGDMMSIVDGLAQEVEQIKSDGRVDPNEVLGLFDNMMQMVTLLVNTKAPSKPRQKRSE